MKELTKRMIAAKATWGLGERRCKNDFNRRKMLFEYLLKSTVSLWSGNLWVE